MKKIAGFWKFRKERKELLKDSFMKMTGAESLGRDCGYWAEEEIGMILGYKNTGRSETLSEPSKSSCGRFTLVYEGEIYNLNEILDELAVESNLDKTCLETGCEADVLVEAISKWGIETVLKKINGVFVFFLWDKSDKKLFLARDKVGTKQLYYGIQNNVLFFSSMVQAICENDLFSAEIDKNALSLFFRYNCVPAPHSIYKGVKKLKQGSYLVIDGVLNVKEYSYWDALKITEKGGLDLFVKSEQEVVDELENLLIDSIEKRLEKNAITGVLLSGGVDSSLIAGLLQKQKSVPVPTFSVAIDQENYDESVFAREISRYLGTKHETLRLVPRDMVDTINKMPKIYDEPFSDSSQIPTYLVFQFAKKHITTGLSGDGGDEVFGGYNRYLWANKVWKHLRISPFFMKKMVANLIKGMSPERLDSISKVGSTIMPKFFQHRMFGDKLHKLADILTSSSPDELYFKLTSHWQDPENLVLDSKEPFSMIVDSKTKNSIPGFVDRMMYWDLMTYLPDDGLVKVVKASEAAGLNARAPILDHRIIEFSKRLPLSLKIRSGKSKWILREILYKYVPSKLIERPKMGFGVPIDTWLRGPLRDWAEDLLNESALRKDGILNSVLIKKYWQEHVTGKRNHAYHLWDVLMFQSWKQEWI